MAVGRNPSLQTAQSGGIIGAMENINRNCPDINAFFEEFDVYDGRVFEAWEVLDMLNYDK